MQTQRLHSLRTSIALVAVLAGLLFSPDANALSVVRERPSTIWGHVYAGPTGKSALATTAGGAHLEAKSRFVVNYNNFPDWAKSDIQAAIDIWAANFASNTPITVEASWGRSATYGVLGSARPGNYFSNFTAAPDPTLWYPSALANALAGQDLDKSNRRLLFKLTPQLTGINAMMASLRQLNMILSRHSFMNSDMGLVFYQLILMRRSLNMEASNNPLSLTLMCKLPMNVVFQTCHHPP